ncbi:unnamed protein product [Rotaria sp. Silwood2]|nr:unnamed protein product [Rotaria sp. Silwood2]CAF2849520.1 unnamed protein product [Rotaria sp. Silwood2]CAF3119189.1 unnamed protein product [Rotaria sp. Silwood2]CAF3251304.1 unnamed protein product [Rotaria sp. Silwood2]CAF3970386.1 unnamed protein product [Rotaria sp. Silwood2]
MVILDFTNDRAKTAYCFKYPGRRLWTSYTTVNDRLRSYFSGLHGPILRSIETYEQSRKKFRDGRSTLEYEIGARARKENETPEPESDYDGDNKEKPQKRPKVTEAAKN